MPVSVLCYFKQSRMSLALGMQQVRWVVAGFWLTSIPPPSCLYAIPTFSPSALSTFKKKKKKKRRQVPETFFLTAQLPVPTASQISCWQTTVSNLCPTGKVFSRDRPFSVPSASLRVSCLESGKRLAAWGCELDWPPSGSPSEGWEKAGKPKGQWPPMPATAVSLIGTLLWAKQGAGSWKTQAKRKHMMRWRSQSGVAPGHGSHQISPGLASQLGVTSGSYLIQASLLGWFTLRSTPIPEFTSASD